MKKMLLFVVMLLPLVMGANETINYTYEDLVSAPLTACKVQSYQLDGITIEKGVSLNPSIERVINPLGNGVDYYFANLKYIEMILYPKTSFKEQDMFFSEFELVAICEKIKKMRDEAQKDLEEANIAFQQKERFEINMTCCLSDSVLLRYCVLVHHATEKVEADWTLYKSQNLSIKIKDKFDILLIFENYIAEIQNLKIKNSAQ